MTDDRPGPGLSRREMLKSTALAPVAPSLASAVAATLRPMALILPDAQVAGIGYHASRETLLSLARGMRVVLRRDPLNGHDPEAVAIHLVGGERIGYVPRGENTAIAALLDAGHTVVGEITDPERRDFETRLSGDQKPFPGRAIVAEAGLDGEGRRLVHMADVRPRFRAWLATGHAEDAPLPDPDDVPGAPGWKRIVPEFESERCFDLVRVGQSPPYHAGMLLEVRIVAPAAYESSPGVALYLPDGSWAGRLATGDAEPVVRAHAAGLSLRGVVTRILTLTHEQDEGRIHCRPWLEVHASGPLPPPSPEEDQRRIDALREARSRERHALEDAAFRASRAEEQRRHAALLQDIADERQRLTRVPQSVEQLATPGGASY